MANRKLTILPELTVFEDDDWDYVVDKSDTLESPEGTSKKARKSTTWDYIRGKADARYSLKIQFTQVNTYSLMQSIDEVTELTIVKVLNDENKGLENTIYQLWPDGTRMWIAATEDI